MSTRIMALVWPIKIDATAKAVLVSLADNANDAGSCWPSIDTISERTCIARRSVIEAIKRLELAGLLVADRSNGRHTQYVLTLENQCATRTSAPAAPVRHPHDTSAPAALGGCASRTGPVRQPHSNRQGTVNEPSMNRQGAGARDDGPVVDRVEVPDWIDPKHWAQWIAHRAGMKKPLTAHAQQLSIEKLGKLRAQGHDPNEIVSESIVNGWQGLFAPKESNRGRAPPNRPPTRLESAAASFAGTARAPQRTADVIDVTPTVTARLG